MSGYYFLIQILIVLIFSFLETKYKIAYKDIFIYEIICNVFILVLVEPYLS